MKIRLKLHPPFLLILILICIFSTPAVSQTEEDLQAREETYRKLELFSNVLSIIQENYVEEIDTNRAIEGAINGMLLSLDPHSAYLSPENFGELQEETQGSFTGIGIEITVKNGKLTIVSPIEDTPANDAGLQAIDIIVKIDGQWTEDISALEAIKKLRGPKGSEVTISVQRQGWEDLRDFTLVRDVIPVESVRALFLENGIAYTRITNFQSHTTEEYLKSFKDLQRSRKITSVILDLRNNPGGLLNQAVSIADLFLESGLIVYTKGRNREQNMVFQAEKGGTVTEFPLIVLVNEGSASASEIVAGAIQDQKRGLILGTRTFGKGSVQTIVPLQDGSGLRMTTARYFTPSGRSIQAKGIIPDVEIAFVPNSSPDEQETNGSIPTREKDLPNHFENNSSVNSSVPPPPDTETQQELTPQESIMLSRLRQDNQVQTALSILKGVSLLNKK
ncbi:MAG: S41 family peptidase [Desulfopila sp.]|nr:S41 family peptidase [Desulfopila sp.]